MNLTGIFSAWKLSEKLPEWGVLIGLTLALGYALWGCDKTNVISKTEYKDSVITITKDSVVVKFKPVYIDRIHTVVVDSGHDCWDRAVVLPFGLDTVTFDSVNSCKGEYVRGVLTKHDFVHWLEDVPPIEEPEPLPAFVPSFGYRVDAILGPSLPGGTVIGVHGQAWFDRISIFAYPRLVIPDLSRSSVDVGVGYKIF